MVYTSVLSKQHQRHATFGPSFAPTKSVPLGQNRPRHYVHSRRQCKFHAKESLITNHRITARCKQDAEEKVNRGLQDLAQHGPPRRIDFFQGDGNLAFADRPGAVVGTHRIVQLQVDSAQRTERKSSVMLAAAPASYRYWMPCAACVRGAGLCRLGKCRLLRSPNLCAACALERGFVSNKRGRERVLETMKRMAAFPPARRRTMRAVSSLCLPRDGQLERRRLEYGLDL